VVGAAQIRFRRELRLFRPFALETRILAWTETAVIMEQRVVARGRDGAEILSAVALVRAGLYDRRAKAYVPVARILAAIGRADAASPAWSPEVAAFVAAEEALKAAA
jgi:acyl-CoA thioesterase FadM